MNIRLNDGLDFDCDPGEAARSLAEALEQPRHLPAFHAMLNAMPKPPHCEFCGTDLRGAERVYRVTEICESCFHTHQEELEDRWCNYLDERYETPEANS